MCTKVLSTCVQEGLEEDENDGQATTGGAADHSGGKRKYMQRKCPGCGRVIGFNYKKRNVRLVDQWSNSRNTIVAK